MRRIVCISDYCNPSIYPKLKVAPPVFSSPLDAWNHFVRHPDDFPLLNDESFDLSVDFQSDVFDKMDSFFNSKEVEHEVPLGVAAGNEEAEPEELCDESAASEVAGE